MAVATLLAVGGAAWRRRRRSRGRFGCAVLAVPAEGGGGGGASRAARAGKLLVSASEFWSRRTPAPEAAAGAVRARASAVSRVPSEDPAGSGKGEDGGGGRQRRWRRHRHQQGRRRRGRAAPHCQARAADGWATPPSAGRTGRRGAPWGHAGVCWRWGHGAVPRARGAGPRRGLSDGAGARGSRDVGARPRGAGGKFSPAREWAAGAGRWGPRSSPQLPVGTDSEDVFAPPSRTGATSVTASCLGWEVRLPQCRVNDA